jgi:hypothetical protein
VSRSSALYRLPGPRLFWVVLLGAAPAFAARALTVEDEVIEGELLGLDASPTLTLSVQGKPRRIPCGDLLALEIHQGEPERQPTHASAVLRSGGRLQGLIRGGTGRTLTLRGTLFESLECPLEAIARVELPVPQPSTAFRPAEKLDRLLLLNGETIDGTVESVDAKTVHFRSELLGELELGLDRIAAIAFASRAVGGAAPPEGVLAIVHARDGTVIRGQLRGLKGGRLEVRALFGATLALDLEAILRVEFRGGRLVYLSDLEPAAAKETPFFDLVWHYRRDRSVDGNPLRLGTRAYPKGLGVHSRSELTYALEGAYRRFLAHVGIDEEVGGKGNVDVQVLVDGTVRFDRKGLRGSDEPVPVALDVAGAKTLTLRVDFGEGLDICDHVDWANARVIR